MKKERKNLIRELAKSNYYQILYSRAKELNFKLFNNNSELTNLQVTFLSWLETYSSVYRDIAMDEDYATEELIADDLLMDSYLVYRRKQRGKEKKPKETKSSNELPGIIFT